MKVLSFIFLIILVGCSSVPLRQTQQFELGNVTIVMTDPEEIWDRFGCEGRLELLPDGRFRIYAPIPANDSDRHAWEVLGHEMNHVLTLSPRIAGSVPGAESRNPLSGVTSKETTR